ncbi:MAG: hypothetical protein C3F19_03465 [Rhodocyclales bacterium]|nr:MAG: hypothetical protein C3F19_03465 [Rhodocyclales bacterium]
MSKTAIPRGNHVFVTIPGQAPEFAALQQMLNDVLAASSMSRSDALTYALAWLAAGKLLSAGAIAGYREYSDLLQRDCWEAAERSGLPSEVTALIWSSDGNGRVQDWVNVKLLGLLADFTDQFDPQELEFADAVAEIIGPEASGYNSGMCDAIISLLQAPPGSVVWIPFDGTGQLTIRALRQGLKVVLDGPSQNRWSVLTIKLLAVIAGKVVELSTDAGIRSGDTQDVDRSFDYLIACPPIGLKLQPGAGWRRWEGSELGLTGSEAIYKRMAGQNYVQLDRAEPWAMAALWPRVKFRAVFMTGLNLLFAKGQEQRLREFLVLGLQQPSVVATLPPKLLHHAGIPIALTVFDRTRTARSVRLVDSSSMTIESKSTMRFSRQLDSTELVRTIQSQEDVVSVAKTVSLDEVAAQECNLMPVRYLKALAAGDLDRVALGDLVEVVIRAPVVSKDATAIEVQEVGIADLDRWRELHGPFVKSTTVQAKKLPECSLQPGDIIVSIKGTIGKIGLIGVGATQSDSVVCGQSVVAIRPKHSGIGTVALYLYLRSEDFRGQLDAFRVGAAVAHVTPATLLQEVKVPRQSLLSQTTARERYAELCALEHDAEMAYQRIEEIRRSL